VEMEGAAVAQICHEYGVPCAVLRTVSDRADGGAPVDFKAFLHEVASSIPRALSGGSSPRFDGASFDEELPERAIACYPKSQKIKASH